MNTSFERAKDGKDEWLTPPEIIKALGEFDLDPCAPMNRPWDTAKKHYTALDDGMRQEWEGRVWLNPPYGTQTARWMRKLAEHGNGIALTFARTETKTFFPYVWEKADGILFIKGRLRFYHVNGSRGDSAGAPSCLIAYGTMNMYALKNSGLDGCFLTLPKNPERNLK